MMDVVTGKTRPDSGEVFFGDDTDLTRLDEPAIANLGIGRKFQRPTVFENRIGLRNLELALAGGRTPRFTLFARLTPRAATASRTSSRDRACRPPRPARRRAVARPEAMARDRHAADPRPQLLLLDEPVAGMTDRETEETAELILDLNRHAQDRRRRARHGLCASLGARVTVLHEGSVLAEGSIDHVQSRPARDRSLSRPLSGQMLLRSRRSTCITARAIALRRVARRPKGRGHRLLGRNGVGKTSLLRAIFGAHPIRRGSIRWEDAEIASLPIHERARAASRWCRRAARSFRG